MISFKKNKTPFNVGLHSNMYRSSSLALGILNEMTKFYILIPVWMTLFFIQGHTGMKDENFLVNVSIDLDKISCVATAYWFVEALAKSVSHDQYSKDFTLLTRFYKINL